MVEPFPVILADVPWPYGARRNPHTKFGQGVERYDRKMTITELCAMGPLVQAVVARDAVMYFWTTGPWDRAEGAHQVITSWGFRVSTWGLVWVKYSKNGRAKVLPGNKTASNAELAFLCWKGKPLPVGEHLVPQILDGDYGKLPYSRKPDEQYERIERAFPQTPRLELFATQRREGWTSLGWELTQTDIRDELVALAKQMKGEYPDGYSDHYHDREERYHHCPL